MLRSLKTTTGNKSIKRGTKSDYFTISERDIVQAWSANQPPAPTKVGKTLRVFPSTNPFIADGEVETQVVKPRAAAVMELSDDIIFTTKLAAAGKRSLAFRQGQSGWPKLASSGATAHTNAATKKSRAGRVDYIARAHAHASGEDHSRIGDTARQSPKRIPRVAKTQRSVSPPLTNGELDELRSESYVAALAINRQRSAFDQAGHHATDRGHAHHVEEDTVIDAGDGRGDREHSHDRDDYDDFGDTGGGDGADDYAGGGDHDGDHDGGHDSSGGSGSGSGGDGGDGGDDGDKDGGGGGDKNATNAAKKKTKKAAKRKRDKQLLQQEVANLRAQLAAALAERSSGGAVGF